MKSEPVRILLNGAAGVVNLILVALVLTGVVDLDGTQTAAIVAAVQAVCALLAEVVRAQVTPAGGAG